MSLQNRATLKTYFETGDYPTEEQFANLLDSIFNKVDDDGLVGLTTFKPTVPYKAGKGVFYAGAIYMALVDTQGTFDPVKWQQISNPSGVLEFEIFEDFPVTGVVATIYVDKTTNFGYRWNGAEYVLLFKLLFNSDELAEGAVNKFYTDARSAENEKITNKGVAGGYASLDGGGKVPAAQLPSYVDDVLEYANYAALPVTGESGKIYVLVTPYTSGGITSSQFRWSGSTYAPIIASPGTTDAVTEGSTNLYFTYSRVRATLMTGVDLVTGGTGLATDSLLVLLGKTYANVMAHISNTSNPHGVTKSQVGLGNVDNTSDSAKPVSTATQTALYLKQDTSTLAATVLALVLTGFTVPASSAVIASDSILSAFGKIQAQINANVTALATKATVGGTDAPAGTYRLGTGNAQSVVIRTNGIDRLTTDASGNIVQAGTATTFDLVIPRLRNTVGGFFRFISNTVAGQLDLGIDFTEINFLKPITNWKGTGSRVVESDSAGNSTAVEEIVSLKIFNPTVQGLLSTNTNWNSYNDYTGTSLSTYALVQGQYYSDDIFYYYMNSITVPLRIPRHRVQRRLTNTYASTKNVSSGLTTLIDYTLPANTLNKNNDSVEFYIEGSFISPNLASFEIILGGVSLFSKSAVATSNFVKVTMRLVRTSSNNQTVYIEALSSSGAVVENGYSNMTLTDTATINLLVKGQDTTGNTVEVKLFEVNFKPSI